MTVLLDEAKDFELTSKRVLLQKGAVSYDYLVLSLGGVTSYFGHPEWEQFAPGLKSLEDAVRIRRNVLLAFERAENEPNQTGRDRLMTILVVGGGPTDGELAGAFAELARHVLKRDFRRQSAMSGLDLQQFSRADAASACPKPKHHLPFHLLQKPPRASRGPELPTRKNATKNTQNFS